MRSHQQAAATWPWSGPLEVHTLSRVNANGLWHTGPCDRTGSSRAISWCLLRLISDSRLRASAPAPPPPGRRAQGLKAIGGSVEGVDESTQPTCLKGFKDRASWGAMIGHHSYVGWFFLAFCLFTPGLISEFVWILQSAPSTSHHKAKQSADFGLWRWD
jgi:hypothetical protein